MSRVIRTCIFQTRLNFKARKRGCLVERVNILFSVKFYFRTSTVYSFVGKQASHNLGQWGTQKSRLVFNIFLNFLFVILFFSLVINTKQARNNSALHRKINKTI